MGADGSKRAPKREPNGNRSLAARYLAEQCGALFRRGFSLVDHRNRLYVRAAGTKIPLHLPLSASPLEVQNRALELRGHLAQHGGYQPAEWEASLGIGARLASKEILHRDREAVIELWHRRKSAEGVSEKTFKHFYLPHLQRLHSSRPLSQESLLGVIERTPPESHVRKRTVSFLRELTAMCDGQWNAALLDPLQMKGVRRARREQPFFRDDQIEAILTSQRVPNPGWRRVIALLAVYGLRPWEAWVAEPSREHAGCVWIPCGKKNSKGSNPPREVPPFHPEWVSLFQIESHWSHPLPRLSALSWAGNRVSAKMRDYGIDEGQTSYGFRHAYARRMHSARYRVPDGDAALFMGHTVGIHVAAYRRWIEAQHNPIGRYAITIPHAPAVG